MNSRQAGPEVATAGKARVHNSLSMIDPSGFSWLSSAFHAIGHFFSKYWKVIVAIVVSVVSFGTLAPMVSAWLATSMCLAEGTITVGGAMVADVDCGRTRRPATRAVVKRLDLGSRDRATGARKIAGRSQHWPVTRSPTIRWRLATDRESSGAQSPG